MDFFQACLKKIGLVHFQRPHARGLSMKNVFLEPWLHEKKIVLLFINVKSMSTSIYTSAIS